MKLIRLFIVAWFLASGAFAQTPTQNGASTGLLADRGSHAANGPAVELLLSKSVIEVDRTSTMATDDPNGSDPLVVEVKVTPTGFREGTLGFKYAITGGRIIGEGASVIWDLGGSNPGTYTVSVQVAAENSKVVTATRSLEIRYKVATFNDPIDAAVDEENAEADSDDTSEDQETPPCRGVPVVSLGVSSDVVYLNRPPTEEARARGTEVNIVRVDVTASNPNGDSFTYTYSVNGGRIFGTGPMARWDLWGVSPGTYFVTVAVDDGEGAISWTTTGVEVRETRVTDQSESRERTY